MRKQRDPAPRRRRDDGPDALARMVGEARQASRANYARECAAGRELFGDLLPGRRRRR